MVIDDLKGNPNDRSAIMDAAYDSRKYSSLMQRHASLHDNRKKTMTGNVVNADASLSNMSDDVDCSDDIGDD